MNNSINSKLIQALWEDINKTEDRIKIDKKELKEDRIQETNKMCNNSRMEETADKTQTRDPMDRGNLETINQTKTHSLIIGVVETEIDEEMKERTISEEVKMGITPNSLHTPMSTEV